MTDNSIEELKQPIETPVTDQEALATGWRFSNHLNYIFLEYEAAITALSQAQFEYDNAESEALINANGKSADIRKAQVIKAIEPARKKLKDAKDRVDILKIWKHGREAQLEWARSALSFLKGELEAAKG